MNWLLEFDWLFPQYRALQAKLARAEHERDEWKAVADEDAAKVSEMRLQLTAANTDKLILQDRLDAVMEDRSKLWDLVRECIQGERTAYQLHVNVASQQRGFGVPYPDAPHAPANAVGHRPDEPTIPRRKIGSELVAEQTGAFIKEYAERFSRP